MLNILRMNVISLACHAALIYSAEVYVSPTGSDVNDGSLNSPLATLAAARDKADNLKSQATPVTIYLRAGTYYLAATDTIGASNSGTAAAPITYSAYQNEKPVISGGIKITPAWTAYSGKIMVTTIDKDLKIDQLFLNGKRQIMCRYPNFDSTQYLDGYAADALTRAGSDANPAEGPGYIRALHSNLWGGESYIITGKSGTAVTYGWVGDHGLGNSMHPIYRMIENIFEELDAPGEWFYRKTTGQLFFYPPDGADLSTAIIELASLDELLVIKGTSAANPVQYLRFTGITFTHTYRTLFSQPYVRLQGGDWTVVRGGAIYIENAESLQFDHCFFDQIGGNGIFMSGYNKSHVVERDTFIDAGASCVLACGNANSTRASTDRTPGPANNDYPSLITIQNNLMDHFGRFEKQTSGTCFSATMNDTVRHNEICRCPRAGINCTDGCWGGHEICWNWVYKAVLESNDHGPFNSWGRDRNYKNNTDTSLTEVDAMYTTKIHDNRMEAAPPLFGIDLDDGSSNYDQWNNLLVGVGLKLWHGRHNRYHNNILVDGGVDEFHDTYPNSGDYYAHNIIVGSVIYSFCCFSDMSASGLPTEVSQRIPMFDSNCVWSFGSDPKMCQWQLRDTITTNWTAWKAAGLDAHTQLADPLFADTERIFRADYKPRGDWSVKDNSPALTMGFKNFPMDSFGIMPEGPVPVATPLTKNTNLAGTRRSIRYVHGTLFVSIPGDYKMTITSPLGKTIADFSGRGARWFALAQGKKIAQGAYFAVIHSAQGIIKQRFLVN
jgi:hypothetical protein